jgi:hypothetical protein
MGEQAMNKPGFYLRLLASGLTAVCVLFSGMLAKANDEQPIVASIDSVPEGQTYGRWAALWQEWAVGIPAAENPVSDTTGQYCRQRQVDRVWFLAGTFGPGVAVRTCNIPARKALFFPLIDNAYFAFSSDPPDQRTEEFVRSKADCTLPAQISVSIDGSKVVRPQRFFTGASGSESPIFNVQLPSGNIFGADETTIPELLLSQSAEQGYYLFLYPLSPDKHTIRWVASGCVPNLFQDITYNLTVAK